MGKEISACSPDKKWQVESDLRTLCEAEEIKKDPKRFKACQDMAREKMVEMGSVAGSDDGKK